MTKPMQSGAPLFRSVNHEEPAMPTKKESPTFKTIQAGTSVTWHYRSAVGHSTVTGVHKLVRRRVSHLLSRTRGSIRCYGDYPNRSVRGASLRARRRALRAVTPCAGAQTNADRMQTLC
jgi:hypothetical protein